METPEEKAPETEDGPGMVVEEVPVEIPTGESLTDEEVTELVEAGDEPKTDEPKPE